MEDTLRGNGVKSRFLVLVGLNPCFNGRYSQRQRVNLHLYSSAVLILVLMEDTLRVMTKSEFASILMS